MRSWVRTPAYLGARPRSWVHARVPSFGRGKVDEERGGEGGEEWRGKVRGASGGVAEDGG